MKFKPPKRLNEVNIQAELYMQLRRNQIQVYLEYPIPCLGEDRNMLADIAIIARDEVVMLIEVKSRMVAGKGPNIGGKQYGRYMSSGLPFLYCTHMSEVTNTVVAVLDLLRTPKG